MVESIATMEYSPKTREYIREVSGRLESQGDYARESIPETLKDHCIVGQTRLPSGEVVFIGEDHEFREIGQNAHQSTTNNNGVSNKGYVIYSKEAESLGVLAVSLESQFISIDWMDTFRRNGRKGLGKIINQLAVEIAYLNNKGGAVRLRSLNNTKGYHYRAGYRTAGYDQYKEDGDASKFIRKNLSNGYTPKKFQKDLLWSARVDTTIRDSLVRGEQHNDKPTSILGGGPGDETPMRLSEYGATITSQDSDDKKWKTRDDYLKWLKGKNEIERSKYFYLKTIERNPILDETATKLKSGELILD